MVAAGKASVPLGLPRALIRGRARLALYGALVALIGLAGIELLARWAEPAIYRKLGDFHLTTAPAEYKLWQQTLFSSFGGFHRPDPELLWAFRPQMRDPLFTTNSRGLLAPAEITCAKPPNTIRILLLGDSSPVGLGLRRRNEAFGELAASMLSERWRGVKRVELINAAVSGYTSEQGRRFLEREGVRYQPDIVVCYFGNNDASINGYLTDREIFAAQDWAQAMRRTLYRFATYRLLRGMMSPLLRDRSFAKTGSPKVRVTVDEFRDNMARLAAAVAHTGGQAIFINPPVPLRWPAGLEFKIFSRMTDSAGQWVVADPIQRQLEQPAAYCLDPAAINRPYGRIDPYVRDVFISAYVDAGQLDSLKASYLAKTAASPTDPLVRNNLGVLYWRERDFTPAIAAFRRCLLADSSFNVARYNLGIALADAGDTLQAREYLSDAVDRDYYSLRIKTPYRKALAAAAREGGAIVLDAAGLFSRHDNERLFIDHCHPTPEGHLLIAERLAVLIDSLLRQ